MGNFHHKNAISISGRYYIAIFEKQERKKNYSKQQKCYTTSLRILSPNTERIFCRLVLISVSPPPNLLFIETEIRMIHTKKSFLLKKVDFTLLQFPSQHARKKNREIKRVLNDFAVTYQKNTSLPLIWQKIRQ